MVATSVWVPKKLTGKLTSPSSLSLAVQTLESLAHETTSPCLPSFLAFPPIMFPASLTFNQRDYEQKWSLKLDCHSSIAPRR